MDNTEQEMNEALDALEATHNIDPEPIVNLEIVEDLEEPEELDEPEVLAEPDKAPKGYLTLEEWEAQGKDPDDYKGKNAYSAEYERIKEIKELKAMTSKLVEGVGEWKADQEARTRREVEKARTDLKAELASATDDADVDRALEAQRKINDLDQTETPAAGVNPEIKSFYSKNPIIDKSSDQFSQDFYDDCSMMQHNIINQLTGGDPEQVARLTPAQVKRSMSVAYEQAKALHPDKFTSRRNSRQQAPAQSRRAAPASKSGDYGTRLKSLGASSKNSRDTTPALDMYNQLLSMDKDAAENFAKKMLQEQ